jgi:hypothetical protein
LLRQFSTHLPLALGKYKLRDNKDDEAVIGDDNSDLKIDQLLDSSPSMDIDRVSFEQPLVISSLVKSPTFLKDECVFQD